MTDQFYCPCTASMCILSLILIQPKGFSWLLKTGLARTVWVLFGYTASGGLQQHGAARGCPGSFDCEGRWGKSAGIIDDGYQWAGRLNSWFGVLLNKLGHEDGAQ